MNQILLLQRGKLEVREARWLPYGQSLGSGTRTPDSNLALCFTLTADLFTGD